MPVSWTALFRLVVLLLLAAHVFYFYAFARLDQEVVGLDGLAVLACGAFSLVMLVPLAWAAAVPDLPVILRSHLRRRRWQHGRCADCGHSLLRTGGDRCPECGASKAEPRAFEIGWGTARRFGVLALAAWLVGCVGAESWAALDERAFAREARAHVSQRAESEYSRPRRWPMQDGNLYYTDASGVTAYSPDIVLPQPAPSID